MRAHENPFRSERIEALAFRDDACAPADLLAHCRAQRGRGALVGPKGHGKTTLLRALASELRTAGSSPVQVRLTEEQPRPDWRALRRSLRGRPPPPLLLDGAEQLGWFAWWRLRWLARHAPVLIVTTHRPGRLPVLRHHATTPGLLAGLVGELLRGSVPSPPVPTPEELEFLFRKHGGNLRECFRELYDRAARN